MAEQRFRLDALRVGPMLAVVRWVGFPYVFQAAALAVVVGLIANGWGVGLGRDGDFLKILRKTNATTLMVWGLWWPAMVIVVVSLGRAWCTACPMELVSNLAHRAGRAIGFKGVAMPRLLGAGFGILALFALLQFLVGGIALHRSPAYTATMLLVLLSLAAGSGLVFARRRSFCKAFCPANLLLSVYGRLSPVQVAATDDDTCAGCETKDCIRKDCAGRWNIASCGSGVPVYNRRDGDDCVLCFQCVKSCPHDNVGFGVQARASRRPSALRTAEVLFVMLASGFVMHELFTEIKPLDGIFHWPAEQIHGLIGTAMPWSWMHATWYLVIFPAMLWLIALGVSRLTIRKASLGAMAGSAALAVAPVIAAAHISKALAKLNSWGMYLPISLGDPNGLSMAESLAANTTAAPATAVPFVAVSVVAIALCGLGAVLSLLRARRSEAGGIGAVALVSATYLVVVMLWPWFH